MYYKLLFYFKLKKILFWDTFHLNNWGKKNYIIILNFILFIQTTDFQHNLNRRETDKSHNSLRIKTFNLYIEMVNKNYSTKTTKNRTIMFHFFFFNFMTHCIVWRFLNILYVLTKYSIMLISNVLNNHFNCV